ncbi:tetratricopeptide repeat protein [Ottowia thiooxydans]|uniref:Zn-dependent protease n=1 Tax=Ottowia thiooxydans TaxID=219182 RepID=A0ABV2QIK2_9BURK
MNSDITDPLDELAAKGISASQLELMDLLSYIYLRHGLPDKAAVLLSARDLLSPDNRSTLLTLALAQVRAGKPERALETLERLALIGAVDAAFHLVRAQAFHALGRMAEAAGAMKAHLALRTSQKNSGPATVN